MQASLLSNARQRHYSLITDALSSEHIRLTGRAFGVQLSVEEVVFERVPPKRKAWVTTGQPNLLVIGHYRMGFETSPKKQERSCAGVYP